MTVTELRKRLEALEAQGKGDLPVVSSRVSYPESIEEAEPVVEERRMDAGYWRDGTPRHGPEVLYLGCH